MAIQSTKKRPSRSPVSLIELRVKLLPRFVEFGSSGGADRDGTLPWNLRVRAFDLVGRIEITSEGNHDVRAGLRDADGRRGCAAGARNETLQSFRIRGVVEENFFSRVSGDAEQFEVRAAAAFVPDGAQRINARSRNDDREEGVGRATTSVEVTQTRGRVRSNRDGDVLSNRRFDLEAVRLGDH